MYTIDHMYALSSLGSFSYDIAFKGVIMVTNRLLFTVVFFTLFLIAPASGGEKEISVTRDAVLGVWETAHTENGYSHVEIYETDGEFKGHIIWLSNPLYPEDDEEGMGGQPRVDRNNPDDSRRNDPIIGLELMHSFEFDPDDGKWVDGRIYDPENGKTYRCKMTLKDAETLEIFGYIKVVFAKIGRNTTWIRVHETRDTPVDTMNAK